MFLFHSWKGYEFVTRIQDAATL